jgi:hypothetical protein
MKTALNWLDKNKVKPKIVSVVDRNEEVIGFYNCYGFYTRKIVLEQIME